jgi:hypothetical protein
MTKVLKVSDIVSQKLEHINYYRADHLNDGLFIGMARDACYSANNTLVFKRKQIADSLAEYDRHKAEDNTYAKERSEQWIARLYPELEVLEECFDIAKAVYSNLTGGEDWKPAEKKQAPPKLDVEALRKRVA